MENKKAIKVIDKILKDLDKTGVNTDVLIDDIKELRTYALEAQIPLVVKVLRLTYEHIEENDAFVIPMLVILALLSNAIISNPIKGFTILVLIYLVSIPFAPLFYIRLKRKAEALQEKLE